MRTFRHIYFELKVDDCNLDYVGSLSLPEKCFTDELPVYPNEVVHVFNRSTGKQFETYAQRGDSVCLNGAAARMGEVGDIIEVTTERLE